ncbi:Uu.00g034470.m01.CDS01 [Anthostomella pinea]|uniref:Uu.00g034470.m01.CDS01 n=1 Tax=Anthostomella pinea TaxID=933095 RepID=A0AAI8YAY9_9PEZI|nr:Uu.00g034470.m01.CDS01 [Anthostomella pinea]
MQSVTEKLDRTSVSVSPEKAEAESFLKSLLNKSLRIHTTDSRMFIGTFKCTDTHTNVVLALTYEYRQPSHQKLAEAAAAAANSRSDSVKADMTSRYLGLVVIPDPLAVHRSRELLGDVWINCEKPYPIHHPYTEVVYLGDVERRPLKALQEAYWRTQREKLSDED